MHTVQLLLKPSKYERYEIDRRFRALEHLHNVCVKHARKCMVRLQYDKDYAALRQQYLELSKKLSKKEELSKEDKAEKKALSAQLAERRSAYGLSKSALECYLKVCGKQFSKLLSSQQVQTEADRVWCGVEKCLFGNGKVLRFKRFIDFDTIGGKSNKNGACFDSEAMMVSWVGLLLKCFLPKSASSRSYVEESLKGTVCYCNIKRKMFSSGWRYYAEIILKEDAPARKRSIGTSTMGIDPGVSTVAGVSETACVLEELAPKAIRYEKKIQVLSQSMDRSRRISNPDKYNEDGTIKRSKHEPWRHSENYLKMSRMLKTLHRKRHAYIVGSHRQLCNKLLLDSKYFLVEKMQFQALQKRAKETKRQEAVSEVRQKNGGIKLIQKFKRKKRFGKSISRRAPARFLLELKQKAEAVGGGYAEVDTKEFKASQYNHVTGNYEKISLSQREKQIGGRIIQRDLYSAFLIHNADPELKHPDIEKCKYEFKKFADKHDQLILSMKKNGLFMRQCFGF